MKNRTWGLLIVGSLLGLLGCSSDGGGNGNTATGGASGSSGAGAGGGMGGSMGGGGTGGSPFAWPPVGGGTGGACGMASSDTPGCTAQQYVGQNVPLDIYVMFDQSGSMAIKDDMKTMRIDAVRSAVEQFLNAPESNGIHMGIGYFGHQPLENARTSCNPADYATPAVTMGALPGHAAAIMASLKSIQPTGETPTGAAIRGACSYAKGWKQTNAGHQVAILLVTDGEPQAPLTKMANPGYCEPTLADATAAAAECLSVAPALKTYVLGIGPSLQNLKSIAEAGGTKDAYLVASGGTAEILKALHQIRGDATIPCTLQIPRPSSGTVDFGKVNVVYRDTTCMPTTFVNVMTAGGCTPSGGWYYDNASKPEAIQLCPGSCEQVKKPGSQLNITVGCATRIVE